MTSGWTEQPESSTIETIADGVVDGTGAFCRTFWYWDEDRPLVVAVRARVASVTHHVEIEMSKLRYWLAMDYDGKCDIWIEGHRIKVPTKYLEVMPAQIAWLKGDLAGPIPGEQCS